MSCVYKYIYIYIYIYTYIYIYITYSSLEMGSSGLLNLFSSSVNLGPIIYTCIYIYIYIYICIPMSVCIYVCSDFDN